MKKSVFSQLILLIVVALLCVAVTVVLALWAGSAEKDFLNLQNFNWSNAIPVILVGGFVCCVVVGIVVLFVTRNVFHKTMDYLSEINKNGGKEE
ncbi:MAG: hypothetical protein IKW10_01690 [Oscillospiraceae bacterium]|nr:hypothetical protein [Oscillospiraceae bacterium]